MLYLSIIMFLCFLLRAIPRLRLKNTFISDTYFHLYCASVIRENSFRLPKKLPRVILSHVYTYPYLYHYLLALFPLKYRLWLERFTGAIFDTISLILIYAFSLWAFRWIGKNEYFPTHPIIVSALFAFSPALLRVGSGPRAYNGSPRVIGQMLYLLHLLAGYYAYSVQSLPGLVIALLSGATLIITAKFGTQVLFFFGFWFSTFISYYYIFLLMGCLLLAIALTKGHAWRVIQGHIRHSVFYSRYLQSLFLFPHIRTVKKYFRSALSKAWKTFRFLQLGDAIRWYYSEQYFLHVLVTVCPQFLLFFYFLIHFTNLNSLDQFMVVWMGAGLFWFLLTKFRPFLFLGEGERYLEYALFPSLFLVAKLLSERYAFLLEAFFIYSVISAFFFMWLYDREYRKVDQNFNKVKNIFSELNRLPEGVILPIGSFHYQALYFSHFPVLTHGSNIDEQLLPYQEFKLVYGNYPYPSHHFLEIVNRYHVSYIVSDAVAFKYYREKVLKEPGEVDRSVRIRWDSPTFLVGEVTR